MTSTQKVIAVSAGVEAAIGLALIIAPLLVGHLLFGSELVSFAVVFARFFGVALIALSLGVWPDGDGVSTRSGARAMLVYNAGLALYLTWLGAHWHMSGILLWPAVVFHAVITMLLAFSFRPVNDEA